MRLAERPAVRLALLVGLGLALRYGFLSLQQRVPGFEWVDPDHYAEKAYLLNPTGHDWAWTLEAVRYFRFLKAPLYPVFLSAFRPFRPHYLESAAVAQILVDGLSILGVFLLGRALVSTRAGLLAAALMALWFPGLASTSLLLQERLYVPVLVLGLGLLARASQESRGWRAFGAAGFVLGVAALARSMPVFFVAPAALLVLLTAGSRRRGLGRAAALLAGFALPVLPYSALVSAQVGRPVLVETIGSHALYFNYRADYEAVVPDDRPATLAESVQVLAHRFAAGPRRFVSDLAAGTVAMLSLGGGRWLQTAGRATSREAARALEALVHVLGDLPFALVVILAPLGLVAAPGRRAAALVALWIGVHLGLSVLAGYAGPRFRGPADPGLIALAAAFLAGARPPRGWARAAATLTALAIAAVAISSAPRSLRAHPDYGIGRWLQASASSPRRTVAAGSAGVNLLSEGKIELAISRLDEALQAGAARLRLSVDGRPPREVVFEGVSRTIVWSHSYPAGRIAYIELVLEGAEHLPKALLLERPAGDRTRRTRRRPSSSRETRPGRSRE